MSDIVWPDQTKFACSGPAQLTWTGNEARVLDDNVLLTAYTASIDKYFTHTFCRVSDFLFDRLMMMVLDLILELSH